MDIESESESSILDQDNIPGQREYNDDKFFIGRQNQDRKANNYE